MDDEIDSFFILKDSEPIEPSRESKTDSKKKKKKKKKDTERISILDADIGEEEEETTIAKPSSSKKKKKKKDKETMTYSDMEDELEWELAKIRSQKKGSATRKAKKHSLNESEESDHERKRKKLSKEAFMEQRRKERMSATKKRDKENKMEKDVTPKTSENSIEEDIEIMDSRITVTNTPNEIVNDSVDQLISEVKARLLDAKMREHEFRKELERISKSEFVVSSEDESDQEIIATTPETKDSAADDKTEKITLRIRCGPNDEGLKMKVPKTIKFEKIYAHISKEKNIPANKLILLFDNMKLQPDETPADQDMEDNDLIDYKVKP
jgi:hypothetical protein